jgi:hypothetical protein
MRTRGLLLALCLAFGVSARSDGSQHVITVNGDGSPSKPVLIWAQDEHCDPKMTVCNRRAGNPAPCSKCQMECDGEGRKHPDDRCKNYCCESKCSCAPPCD